MCHNFTTVCVGKITQLIIIFLILPLSCKKNDLPIEVSAIDFHNCVDKVVEIMIHDIFSPPVASRIFAYPNIAAYEVIARYNREYRSLNGQISHLNLIPEPDKSKRINYRVAALIAHIEISRQLIFSEKNLVAYRDSLYNIWGSTNELEFIQSKEYGLEVAEYIDNWMSNDNYAQTRTMPKFTVDTGVQGRWQPTPPAYQDGIEPHWDKIRTFVLDSASQFKPLPPPKFSTDLNSDFFKEVTEVYNISNEIVQKGDNSSEIVIAQFWDCNPYVSVTRGHLMFAKKKITPGAHWIGIAKIACNSEELNFDESVYVYTKTSIAIADAFISCWDEKYRSNLIRPETVINNYIDGDWQPILQTPPFPEYTSGHSVVSGAASTVLTSIFRDNFSFLDITEIPFGLPVRCFSSFNEAAQEAAISRLYGGIHYRSAIENGLIQGEKVGSFVNNRLKMKN